MTLLKKLLAVPAEEPDQFFLSSLLYTDQPTQKTAPPPVACLPFYRDPPLVIHPSPLLIGGYCLGDRD